MLILVVDRTGGACAAVVEKRKDGTFFVLARFGSRSYLNTWHLVHDWMNLYHAGRKLYLSTHGLDAAAYDLLNRTKPRHFDPVIAERDRLADVVEARKHALAEMALSEAL